MSDKKTSGKYSKVETVMIPFPKEFGGIQLREIEAFVALIRSGCSVRKAAANLGCGSSDITKRRQRLEGSLEGKLVDTHVLTAKGRKFRKHAEQIYAAACAGLTALEKSKLTLPKILRIGYLETPTVLFYANTCELFNARYSITIAPENPWGHECVVRVGTGRLDIALLVRPHPMRLPKAVLYTELVQYRMFCAVGKKHPLAGRKTVSLQDMRAECVLMMSADAKLYSCHIQMFFSKIGGIRHKQHCPNAVTQIDKVVAGEGVALVMYPMGFFAASRELKLIPIEPPIFMGVGALFAPPTNHAVRDFIEIARQITRSQLKQQSGNAKPPDSNFVAAVELIRS
jgi:DNA-binding transcriptional LysR family regulator